MDEGPPPVTGVEGSLDPARPLESIEDTRHRARGESGDLGEPSRGQAGLGPRDADAPQVGRVEPEGVRDGLLVETGMHRHRAQGGPHRGRVDTSGRVTHSANILVTKMNTRKAIVRIDRS